MVARAALTRGTFTATEAWRLLRKPEIEKRLEELRPARWKRLEMDADETAARPIAAGYSKKTARKQGSRPLTIVHVNRAIDARVKADPKGQRRNNYY
jgi:hypothetical protein